jgi:hypothetical protein
VIAKVPLGDAPLSFNLDFHSIPFRGAEPDLEKHWVAMRNRALGLTEPTRPVPWLGGRPVRVVCP